jgi:hypothetical protein
LKPKALALEAQKAEWRACPAGKPKALGGCFNDISEGFSEEEVGSRFRLGWAEGRSEGLLEGGLKVK